MEYLSLLNADGEAEVLSCIRNVVDNVLQGFLCVDEKGAVVSEQQLCDEFLNQSMVFVHARRHHRLNRLLSLQKWM